MWSFRVGFLTLKVGPDTPKIGALLKTTCGAEEEDGLEDHGVEVGFSDKNGNSHASRICKNQ